MTTVRFVLSDMSDDGLAGLSSILMTEFDTANMGNTKNQRVSLQAVRQHRLNQLEAVVVELERRGLDASNFRRAVGYRRCTS